MSLNWAEYCVARAAHQTGSIVLGDVVAGYALREEASLSDRDIVDKTGEVPAAQKGKEGNHFVDSNDMVQGKEP